MSDSPTPSLKTTILSVLSPRAAPPSYGAYAAAPTPPAPAPEDEEFYSSCYYLQIKRIRAVHETTVSIFAGMFVGMIVRLAPGTMIREMLTFKHTLFFNLLLPPIILNSGYELKQVVLSPRSENFFRHFGSIIVFAFFGTFISAVGVGVIVHIYSMLGIENMDLSLIEGLTFGSTLSATDPVTILAIFNQYKVDPKLYTVIFGESLLNDAVSIVMYETLHKFRGSEVYLSSLFHGVGIFLLSFGMSMFLGVLFGLGMSLLLKHSHLAHFPHIESCLVALSAYICYFLSTGLTLSGIVSLLFCGITLKHYAYHTMSRRTQRASKALFGTLAHLSENFIFIYLGMALFTSAPVSEPVFSYVKPLFILITTIAVVFTRYAAVFPLTGTSSPFLPDDRSVVALAAGFNGPNAKVLRMTVLLVVVITVLVFGSTTARMMEVLKIRTGVEDEDGGSSEEEEWPLSRGIGLSANNSVWGNGGGRRGGRWRWSGEHEESTALGGRGPGRIGSQYPNNSQNPGRRSGDSTPGGGYWDESSEYDSDAEVLPLAPTGTDGRNALDHSHPPPSHHGSGHQSPRRGTGPSGEGTVPGEDNKWFQRSTNDISCLSSRMQQPVGRSMLVELRGGQHIRLRMEVRRTCIHLMGRMVVVAGLGQRGDREHGIMHQSLRLIWEEQEEEKGPEERGSGRGSPRVHTSLSPAEPVDNSRRNERGSPTFRNGSGVGPL
ncbi:monovalent inorganic cation transporter [Coprinopsis sp. MPI-PUGE-AT-0042]|nr:monovalent inorganic cation transporter [Coprinopsis sp. MPI-PUGE-AT-0042]